MPPWSYLELDEDRQVPTRWGRPRPACWRGLTFGVVLGVMISVAAVAVCSPGHFRGQPDFVQRALEVHKAAPVELAGWNGCLGNNICQMGHAITFAVLAGYNRVQLPSYNERAEMVRKIGAKPSPGLFDLPPELSLTEPQLPRHRDLPARCVEASAYRQPDGRYVGGWWDVACRGVSAEEYRDVLHKYLRALFTSELSACLVAAPPQGEGLLTVHLRGADLWPHSRGDNALFRDRHSITERSSWDEEANHWDWAEPPCSLYEKIIVEGGFRSVLVVTTTDRRNPCVAWFEALANRFPVSIKVQTRSLLEDSCALLQARHLVLSYSTFAETMAMLSTRVQRIYSRMAYMQNSMMDCRGWPGVVINRYDVPVNETSHEPYNNTFRGVKDWMLNYPMEKITGPVQCMSH